jgi:hypothetical protein
VAIGKVRDMLGERVCEAVEALEAGPATEWIERYWQDKLDRRPRREGMESKSPLEQMLSLN